MMFDDDYLLELASQRFQIEKNLELIEQMVALKRQELQQVYNDRLSGSNDGDLIRSSLVNPSSRELVFKSGFKFDDDDDDRESSILDFLLDDDDDEDNEDPTQGLSEDKKSEFLRIEKDNERQEQQFQLELDQKKQEQEALDKMTPEKIQEFKINKQLSVYRDELIEIAKRNQDRFNQLAVSEGVLDGDMVELKKYQDMMNGRRAITGEHLDF